MERQTDIINKLSYVEQQRHYSQVRRRVAERLEAIQSLYGDFQKECNEENKTLSQEIVIKGFTRCITESESHILHLDKKLTMLSIIIRDEQKGRQRKESRRPSH